LASSLSSTPFRAAAPSTTEPAIPSTPVQAAEVPESTITVDRPSQLAGDFPTRTQSLDNFFMEANSDLIDAVMQNGERVAELSAAAAQAFGSTSPGPAANSSMNLMNFSEDSTASLHQKASNTQGFAPLGTIALVQPYLVPI